MLLSDEDLVDFIENENLLDDYEKETNWYAKASMVQPCSVDLHVGDIFIPRTPENEPGSKSRPKREHVIGPGETILATTAETLRLPKNIAAFGFPPAGLSSKGILMTNPGHVDAGYVGGMRFVLINMSGEQQPIRRGDEVVTLLFLKLPAAVRASYTDRRTQAASVAKVQDAKPDKSQAASPTTDLDLLARDFFDFRKQVESITSEAIKEAELTIKNAELSAKRESNRVTADANKLSRRAARWAAIVGFAAALIPNVLGLWSKPWEKKDSEIKTAIEKELSAVRQTLLENDKNLAILEASLAVGELEDRVLRLETRSPDGQDE